MNRRFRGLIYQYYLYIAVAFSVVSTTLVCVLADEGRVPLIGTVLVAALGFFYFVQQQKLAETKLFKELFTDFNKRYDRMNDRLARLVSAEQDGDRDGRVLVMDYFNLCAEEYLFYSEGYILDRVWNSWCAGMVWYLEREPFKSIWDAEQKSASYYGLTLEIIQSGAADAERHRQATRNGRGQRSLAHN